MIVIIGFIILVIIMFRYNYFKISNEDCRKNTEDGVTYKDCFGKLRLLRDNRQVKYGKDSNGRSCLLYYNGAMVDKYKCYAEAAKFKGEKDYICGEWGIHEFVFEVFETGEKFLKPYLNGVFYYVEFGNDKPLKIIREVSRYDSNSIGVDIDEFNKLLDELFYTNKNYRSLNYIKLALSIYNRNHKISEYI